MKKPIGKNPSQFTRVTLVEQVVANCRASLRDGVWKQYLPPERNLSELLGVSRPIVREALHLLEKEGFIKIRQGRAALILYHKLIVPGHKKKRIALLQSEPENSISEWKIRAINELRKGCYERGYLLDVVPGSENAMKNPTGLLWKRLIEQYEADCWILAGVPFHIQHWFQDQQLHAVVMGNRFPGIRFPFVNDDQGAIARHAGGTFLGLGHKQVVLFLRKTKTAGEMILEQGFASAFDKAKDASFQVIMHSGEVRQIRSTLHRTFQASRPPTALVVSHALDMLAVFVWLLENKTRIPEEVSLISLQRESCLERLRPLPAWYDSDPKKHAHKLCRLVTALKSGTASPRPIFPNFERNDTLEAPQPCG